MTQRTHIVAIRPTATDREIVAIATAIEALWPSNLAQRVVQRQNQWRFSGRGRQLPRSSST